MLVRMTLVSNAICRDTRLVALSNNAHRQTDRNTVTEDHLLMAPLDTAVPLKQVHSIAQLICKDLHLDVSRPLYEPFQQDALITQRCNGLSFG